MANINAIPVSSVVTMGPFKLQTFRCTNLDGTAANFIENGFSNPVAGAALRNVSGLTSLGPLGPATTPSQFMAHSTNGSTTNETWVTIVAR